MKTQTDEQKAQEILKAFEPLKMEPMPDNKPKDVEKAWLEITNIIDGDNLKITLTVNGEWQEVLFNSVTNRSERHISETHNLSWIAKNSYDLAISQQLNAELIEALEECVSDVKQISGPEWSDKLTELIKRAKGLD